MLITLKNLKQLIVEAVRPHADHQSSFLVAYLETEPNSLDREDLSYDLIDQATGGRFTRSSMYPQVARFWNDMCDILEIDTSAFETVRVKIFDIDSRQGELDEKLEDEYIEEQNRIISKLMTADLERLASTYIDRFGSRASEMDWRSEETTPEDYYAA